MPEIANCMPNSKDDIEFMSLTNPFLRHIKTLCRNSIFVPFIFPHFVSFTISDVRAVISLSHLLRSSNSKGLTDF